MAIKQINAPAWKTHTWTCQCDYCESSLKKLGIDAGEASENARKEGYGTVSVRVDLPMKWACMTCQSKNTLSKGKVKSHA